MSWRLAFHTSKVVVSYWISCAMKTLRHAIFDEHTPTILDLIIQKPNLLYQAIDNDGNTPLGLAIQLGRIKVVKLLLKLGSDPNIGNIFDGNHPLCLLAKSHPQGNPKITALANLLLEAGSNPFIQIRYQTGSAHGSHTAQTSSFFETPLLYCIRLQNEDLLKTFLAYNININTPDKDTFITPLILAASLGYNHLCQLLLNAGAQINASDFEGNTPLHLAIEHPHVMQTLLEYGADVNALNDNGYTPMMLLQRRKRA